MRLFGRFRKVNSAKFAAFRGFSGKLASPRTFIVDSSLLARVSVGWVSTFSEQLLLLSELLVSFPVAHPSLLPLFTLVPRRHVLSWTLAILEWKG
jgi:hypothetical protein